MATGARHPAPGSASAPISSTKSLCLPYSSGAFTVDTEIDRCIYIYIHMYVYLYTYINIHVHGYLRLDVPTLQIQVCIGRSAGLCESASVSYTCM